MSHTNVHKLTLSIVLTAHGTEAIISSVLIVMQLWFTIVSVISLQLKTFTELFKRVDFMLLDE